MNNPNTIENQVLTILKENTDARNDDMKLYLLVCNRCYQRYENQDIGGLPFAVIMNCYKELHYHISRVSEGHEQSFRLHTPNLRPVLKFREDESVVSICIEPMQNRK